MSDPIQVELEKLRTALAGLEAQRAVLGEAIVEPALASLREKIAALEAQIAATAVEQRRIVTILFTDIVGSTALAEKLDPEDWREVLTTIHSGVGHYIQRYEGSVVQYLGDGLLALFGARASSEYDPENAIRAALDIQAGLAALQTGQPIQLRIGIHSGLVVLGDVGSEVKHEFAATGDAMNFAARLQAAAPPGGVLISHDAYRYVRGVFDVMPQAPLQIKGRSEPVQTYLVRRAKPRPFRTVTRGVAGIETRTVGREAEAKSLQSAVITAFEERAVVWAQLVGEPGMGKSRLLSDMMEYLELRPEVFRVFRARAFQGDEKHAFGLIRQMWFDRFQIAEDAPLAEAEARWLEQFLAVRGPGSEEAAHALGLLVGLPFHASPHIGAMRHDPAQVKGRAIVVSRELLTAIRAERPIVILLEDLHWADPSSWEYLRRVILEALPGQHGLCVLATARPEWQPPEALLQHANYRSIALTPLPDAASRELALELMRSVTRVPEEAIQLIVERSEGVPYFVEELINWFLDRGVIDRSQEPWRFDPARWQASPLPSTLQHLLLTRLGALRDGERLVLQRGSIFGRNFWESGLAALGVQAERETLGQLQRRGFIQAQPESSLSGEAEWSFHHNLLRDVTYESVLKRERKPLHKAAAAWLEAQARKAGRLDEFAGLLGEHAERAGEVNAAAEWYLRAGEHAGAKGAPLEASKFLARALELTPPDDLERRWRAVLARTDVVSTLGEPEPYREGVVTLLQLAENLDEERRAVARYRQGLYLEKTGDLRGAVQAYDAALASARRAQNRALETAVLAMKGISQNRLGDLDGADATAQEALAGAREVDEATAARAMNNVAVYYVESGDLAKAAQLHSEQAAISHRLGDRAAEANALGNLGYDYSLLGMYELGRAALEQALQMHQALGARRQSAYMLLNLGLVHWRSGNVTAARQVLKQVQSELAELGDTFGRAAGLSYLALALEHSGNMASAQWRFERARDIFQGMGVLGYAMDASASLARCALAQGNQDEARRYVEEVWGYVQQYGAHGMEFPLRAYQACAEVFEALGEPDRSRAAVEGGYHELIRRAEKISNIGWGKSFLVNVPEHCALLDLWDRLTPEQAHAPNP
ncbi:MAG TPA: adenylate/guanylate cyclase domain-containing protein [Anaerolineae bacterium]|nr:adenylate/guanylate cyclase domain-containing protein [Anaerolineae bacterium]